MPSNAPKVNLHMSHISKRLVCIVASTALLSLVAQTANAQTTNVLTLGSQSDYFGDTWVTTTYTFNSSMILNRIGFVAANNTVGAFACYINGADFASFEFDDSRLGEVDGNGIRWFDLPTSVTLIANDTVKVETIRTLRFDEENVIEDTAVRLYSSVIPNVNVVTTGVRNDPGNLQFTNSNLRVSPSNPGANVAPEPGSFALALTGGAALIGICIRRRRNAG